MANGGWKDRVKALGQDLTSIEVNTVITDGMTGRKMPVYPEALKDIARRFADYLRLQVHLDLDDYFKKSRPVIAAKGNGEDVDPQDRTWQPAFEKNGTRADDLASDWRTFCALRWAATSVLEEPELAEQAGVPLNPDALPVLSRIERHSGELEILTRRLASDSDVVKRLLEAKNERFYDLFAKERANIPIIDAADLTRIRKIWELGTNDIVLQSVVQMDGDIVFRAARTLDMSAQSALVEAHRRATDLGVKHWKTMFELIADLVSGAFKILFPSR